MKRTTDGQWCWKNMFNGRLFRMNKLERQKVWPQNGMYEFLILQVEQFWVIIRMAMGKDAEWEGCHWRYGTQEIGGPGPNWDNFLTYFPVRKPGQGSTDGDRVMTGKAGCIWPAINQVFLSPLVTLQFTTTQIPVWSLIMRSLALWRLGLYALASASWHLKFHHCPDWSLLQVLQRGRLKSIIIQA